MLTTALEPLIRLTSSGELSLGATHIGTPHDSECDASLSMAPASPPPTWASESPVPESMDIVSQVPLAHEARPMHTTYSPTLLVGVLRVYGVVSVELGGVHAWPKDTCLRPVDLFALKAEKEELPLTFDPFLPSSEDISDWSLLLVLDRTALVSARFLFGDPSTSLWSVSS